MQMSYIPPLTGQTKYDSVFAGRHTLPQLKLTTQAQEFATPSQKAEEDDVQ